MFGNFASKVDMSSSGYSLARTDANKAEDDEYGADDGDDDADDGKDEGHIGYPKPDRPNWLFYGRHQGNDFVAGRASLTGHSRRWVWWCPCVCRFFELFA